MAEIKFYQDAAKTNQVYPEINPDGNYPGVTVGLADNLTSDEGIIDNDEWQFRTTGGELDVSDGYATLRNLVGTTESSTIEENLTYNLYTTGITAITVTLSTFKTQISTSGTYNFTYIPIITYSSDLVYHLDENTFATVMNKTTGTYTFTYSPEIARQDPSSLITSFTASTFATKVNEIPGTYVFEYNGSNWQLDGINVTLSQYGITVGSGATSGSTFAILYTANSWYYSGNAVNMVTYGITTTGAEHIGNTIVINYNANQWQLTYGGTTTDNVSLATYGITITGGAANINDLIQIVYTAEEIGAIVTSNPYYIRSIGLNQFDKEDSTKIFDGYRINSDGSWGTNANYKVVYFKVTPETYTIENVNGATLGYAAWSATVPVLGTAFSSTLSAVSSSEWADSLVNTTSKQHFTITTEGYLAVTTADISNLCCHLTWEGVNEGVYETYYNYDMAIPYTDDNGSLIRGYGLVNLDDTTEYYDEIDFVGGKWYQRTDRMAYSAANLATVQALNVPYMYDSNYIYYGIDTITHTLPDASSDYKMSNYGTEMFVGANILPCQAQIFYQDNLKDKLRFSVEVIDNKVNSISSSSTNDQYPSALCMWNVDQALRHILGIDVNTFSTTKTYAVGDYVVYNLKIWKCKVAVSSAGAWTGTTNWDESYLFKA